MVHFKEHFSLGQMSIVHQNPAIFVASQWQHDKSQPNKKYLLYRTCHAGFLLFTWLQTLNGPWYLFLSNWVYTLLTIQSTICWVMLFVATVDNGLTDEPDLKGCTSKYHCVYWLFHSASNASSFLITIIYLTVIYGTTGASFTNSHFFVNGSNSIITFLDLCITAHPVHLLHCLYPLIFGVTYMIFNFAYYSDRARGVVGIIYNIVDIWTLEMCIYLILLHVLTFIIYKLRVMAYNKITKGSTHSQEENHNSSLHV